MFTPTNITAPQDLFNEASDYHNKIKDPFSTDDANACLVRASDLGAWMARTGKMLADAKYWKDEALKGSILKQVGSKLPASTLNELVKAECKNVNYLVNFIEQLDKDIKYQHSFLITAISYRKAEFTTLSYQS